MYAVVRTGGKQYRVAPGDILEVEKIEGAVGDTVTLDDVLLVVDEGQVTIGQPTVAGAAVTAKITGQHRGEKILVFRYRPKKRIRVRRGHRQYLTRLQIEAINGKTARPAVVEEAAPVVEEAEEVQEAAAEVEAAPEAVAETVEEAPVEAVETPEAEEEEVVEAEVAAEADDDSAGDASADDEEGDE